MKCTCLACEHQFEGSISKDELGWHSSCPECDSSFDVDVPDGHIVMVFIDNSDTEHLAESEPTSNVVSYYAFNTPTSFMATWEEKSKNPDTMLYFVLENDKWICSGACDPNDYEIFASYWGLDSPEKRLKIQKEKIDAAIRHAGAAGDLDAADRVTEYVKAVDNAPLLIAEGLESPYKKILEYNGYVLAGLEYEDTSYGYQFATWQYTGDKSGVQFGHYYPTWSQEFGTTAFNEAKNDFALRSGLMISERSFSKEKLADIYELLNVGLRMGLIPTLEKNADEIMKQIEDSGIDLRATSKIDSLIAACEDRVRPAPHEYPAHDYPWGIKEVDCVEELLDVFEHGNWSVRTGFVLGDLAFIEQVSGGNEWLALKLDGGEWKSFDSISFYHMLEKDGYDHCREFIERLQEAPWHELKYPSGPESHTMQM